MSASKSAKTGAGTEKRWRANCSRVRRQTEQPPSEFSEAELARLAELEAELEASAAASPPPPPEAPPPRKLMPAQADPVAAKAEAEAREFGADADDYYPTERHAKHVRSDSSPPPA